MKEECFVLLKGVSFVRQRLKVEMEGKGGLSSQNLVRQLLSTYIYIYIFF